MNTRAVPSGAAGFPGATAISHLKVYGWSAVDGVAGGSPHLHTASTEGYVVLAGHGRLETLSSRGYREIPLHKGVVLWFTPGTVHRLVNGDGELEILVVMQNAGLPEAGDAVLTFPAEVLTDRHAYAEACQIPHPAPDETAEEVTSPAALGARRRRDLAVDGYLPLRASVRAGDLHPLERLWDQAARLVAPRSGRWQSIWASGAEAQSQRTGDDLARLGRADAGHLRRSQVRVVTPEPGSRRYGMCGTLRVWDLDGAHLA